MLWRHWVSVPLVLASKLLVVVFADSAMASTASSTKEADDSQKQKNLLALGLVAVVVIAVAAACLGMMFFVFYSIRRQLPSPTSATATSPQRVDYIVYNLTRLESQRSQQLPKPPVAAESTSRPLTGRPTLLEQDKKSSVQQIGTQASKAFRRLKSLVQEEDRMRNITEFIANAKDPNAADNADEAATTSTSSSRSDLATMPSFSRSISPLEVVRISSALSHHEVDLAFTVDEPQKPTYLHNDEDNDLDDDDDTPMLERISGDANHLD